MPSVAETSVAPTQLAAGLAAGVNSLSYDQVVVFTLYNKVVSPIDGAVYWVNAAVSAGTPTVISAKGSLHYASDSIQGENANNVKNFVIFTSESPVTDFNEMTPTQMYIGEFQGVQFAFSKRDKFYKQANLYHYRGFALYSTMVTQVIDSAPDLTLTVSNSLPLWLSLNQFFPVYPSMLTPYNVQPPYAAVHIDPSLTESLAMVPKMGKNSRIDQLASDTVKITLYGVRNDTALDYLYYLLQNDDEFGLMAPAVIRDEKENQTEFDTIAIKKNIEITVSYYQTRMQDLARQLILDAPIEITVED
jgi:hypothetical protein